MTIQKKSLISSLNTTKKAIVATQAPATTVDLKRGIDLKRAAVDLKRARRPQARHPPQAPLSTSSAPPSTSSAVSSKHLRAGGGNQTRFHSFQLRKDVGEALPNLPAPEIVNLLPSDASGASPTNKNLRRSRHSDSQLIFGIGYLTITV